MIVSYTFEYTAKYGKSQTTLSGHGKTLDETKENALKKITQFVNNHASNGDFDFEIVNTRVII